MIWWSLGENELDILGRQSTIVDARCTIVKPKFQLKNGIDDVTLKGGVIFWEALGGFGGVWGFGGV